MNIITSLNRMDLDLISPNDELQVKKFLFNLKGSYDNGLVLQLHPSFVDSHGERKKCTFLHSSFSEDNLLAVSDTNGSIYIIDLEMQKYWKLPNKGCVSAISFPQLIKSNLIIALNSGTLQMLNIEKGIVSGVLVGHSTPVREISYSSDGKYCLTANSSEAIIWDLLSCSQAHRLSLREDALLKKVLFMPVQGSIFACFQDDAMQIWKFGSFECFKQIIPEDCKPHHLNSVAFTKNGRAMVIGGYSQNIMVFSLDTWSVKKVIKLPDNINGIEHMEFLPQPFDGGANKILGLVTTGSELCLLDIDSSLFSNNLSGFDKLVGNFHVSPNGKYLASMLVSGKIDVYITQKMLLMGNSTSIYLRHTLSDTKIKLEALASGSVCGINKKGKQKWVEELKAVHNELREELNLTKLLPILKQFGEYPESYRVIIWRTILQLPMNQEAYISLANKDCHPSYMKIESKYPLVNKALSNALKRVLSSLAYWCTLFSEVSFLPEFVFPFVKLLHFDPFVCFESVATIIVNWCQNWFEFYPFPPINILTIVENLMGYHDSDLLEFYYMKNITSCLYAYSLMQTAFSEVITKYEWLRLWDHILSNEPSFIFMVVVAFNTIRRNAIKNCESNKDIEEIFHSQNAIDLKLLLTKSYYFMDKTPEDIHPRRFLSCFSPLPKGDSYALYEAYPKLILDRNAAKLHHIQKQEQKILQEQRKAIAMKKELDKKLKTDHEAEFREEILNELDEKFRQIINEEEERISAQRKKLQSLRHELRLKELSVLEDLRDQMLKKKSRRKKLDIKRLTKDIAARKAREKNQLQSLEDEIRNYYSNLLLRKFRLKHDLDANDQDHGKYLSEDLEHVKDKLMEDLGELQDEVIHAYDDKKMELTNKIARITNMLQNIETRVVKELVRMDDNSTNQRSKIEIERLCKETESFEKKLEGIFCNESETKEEITGTSHRGSWLEKKYAEGEAAEQIQLVGENSTEDNSCRINYFLRQQKCLNQEPCDSKEVENNASNFRKTVEHNHRNRPSEMHQCSRSKSPLDLMCEKQKDEENDNQKCHFPFKSPLNLRSKFTNHSTTLSSPIVSESEETTSLSDGKNEIASYYSTFRKGRAYNSHMGYGEISDKEKCIKCLKTFPKHFRESESSSYPSDNERMSVQLALSERRKLIENAKRGHFTL